MSKPDPQTTEVKLWLWSISKDVYVAYDNPCPCDENGDPKVVGEPIATARYVLSVPGARHDN
jgi:hypothetical protein